MDESAADGSTSCANIAIGLAAYLAVVFGIAVLIIIGFALLHKRKVLKLDCCFGIPGLLQPLDFLSGQPSRLVLTAALTALVAHTLQIVVVGTVFYDINTEVNRILDVLVRAVWIVILLVLYFPVVLTALAPIPLLGYFVGLVYVPMLVVYVAFWIAAFNRGCAFTDNAETPEQNLFRGMVLAILPVFVCLTIVFIWYIYRIVTELSNMAGMTVFRDTPVLRLGSYEYVKELFRVVPKPQPSVDDHERGKIRARLKEYRALRSANAEAEEVGIPKTLFARKQGFTFPLTIIFGLTAGVVLCYQLSVFFFFIFLTVADRVGDGLEDFALSLNETNTSNSSACETMETNTTMDVERILNSTDRIVLGLKVFLGAGPTFGLILSLCQILPMIRNVRRHLLLAYRGDYSFCTSPSKLTSQYILRSNMKYPAYQIAYFAWAWVLYVLLFWFLAVVAGIIAVVIRVFPSAGLASLLAILVTAFINIVVQGTVFVLVRYSFIDSISDYFKNFAFTNRRLYNLSAYFMLSFTGFPGVVSAFTRTVYSYFIGLYRAPRMDLPGLQRGSENWDNGHLIYQGVIFLEAVYNNLVGHVFADFLIKSQGGGSLSGFGYPRISKRAYNRWFVAVLLMRNPSLRNFRKSSLLAGNHGAAGHGQPTGGPPLASTAPGIGSINEVEMK